MTPHVEIRCCMCKAYQEIHAQLGEFDISTRDYKLFIDEMRKCGWIMGVKTYCPKCSRDYLDEYGAAKPQ